MRVFSIKTLLCSLIRSTVYSRAGWKKTSHASWKSMKEHTLWFRCGLEFVKRRFSSFPSEKNSLGLRQAAASWKKPVLANASTFSTTLCVQFFNPPNSRLVAEDTCISGHCVFFSCLCLRFLGGSSTITAGLDNTSLGIMLCLTPTAKKNCPMHVSDKNGGLTECFAQKCVMPNRSVLSSFTGTAGCIMR